MFVQEIWTPILLFRNFFVSVKQREMLDFSMYAVANQSPLSRTSRTSRTSRKSRKSRKSPTTRVAEKSGSVRPYKVFGRHGCPYTQKAVEALFSQNKSFEFEYGNDGKNVVPQVYGQDGGYIGGCNELLAHLKQRII